MLVDQEASICQLNSNICPAKIAQRKQAQKQRREPKVPLQTRNRVVNPTHPPRQPPKQKTHEVDDHRQCQHTKKICPATQGFKKNLCVSTDPATIKNHARTEEN